MEKFDLYKDIQTRTGGDIYVGIVGPVRTGKSTFVRKFVEHMVLPELKDREYDRAKDEMPASASGKTVTTVEPKFVPRTAVKVELGDGTDMRIRLVDCVGFLVPGAEGAEVGETHDRQDQRQHTADHDRKQGQQHRHNQALFKQLCIRQNLRKIRPLDKIGHKVLLSR